MNGEGELWGQPANLGSLGKMAIKNSMCVEHNGAEFIAKSCSNSSPWILVETTLCHRI